MQLQEDWKQSQKIEVSGNHFNSREISDDPKNSKVSGGGSEDAILGGLQEIRSQIQMGEDINETTGMIESHRENQPSETHVINGEVSDDPKKEEVSGGGSEDVFQVDYNTSDHKYKGEMMLI